MSMQLLAGLVVLILLTTAIAPLFISKLSWFWGYVILAPIIYCLMLLLLFSQTMMEGPEAMGTSLLALLWLSVFFVSIGIKMVWLLFAAVLRRNKSNPDSTIIDKL